MHLKRIIPVLVVFASAAAMLGGRFLGEEVKRPQLREKLEFPALLKQPSYKRVWRTKVFSKINTIGGQGNIEKAVKILTDAQGNFFVLDLGAKQIKKFSPDGRLVCSFGVDKRGGQGELLFPMDFLIDSLGKVWIADPMKHQLAVFSPTGRLESNPRPPRPVYRLTQGVDGEFWVMHAPIGGALFSLLDPVQPNKAREMVLGELLVHQDQRALALDGSIASGEDGGFVYAPLYFGALLSLDSSGRVRYFRETLDREPMPRIITARDGSTFVDRESPVAALNLSVVGKEIFVLNVLEVGFGKKKVFDTYDYTSGIYLYSFEMPVTFDAGFVLKEGVATLDRTSFTLWSLRS